MLQSTRCRRLKALSIQSTRASGLKALSIVHSTYSKISLKMAL